MVSMHTSPLLTPGTGDAGGLNVYVLQAALHLARRGVAVDIATRATGGQAGVVRPAPDVAVHHLVAGPEAPVLKEDLPQHLDECARALVPLLDRVAREGGVVHSHYWLSGVAALRARELRIQDGPVPPLVHTMHTAARVKNQRLAEGERPEPAVRVRGEDALVADADLLVVNTQEEAGSLVELSGADPDRLRVVAPGVDLQTFRPGPRAEARAEVGLPPEAVVLLFVGRIQPLKAPDVLVRAAGELLRRDPGLRDRLVVAILGGLSGSGLACPKALTALVEQEGLTGLVRFGETMPREELARWYRAADLLVVPSHHESFGLVAIEALASGTPVVAARVGGLPHAVGDVGVLVDGHDPHDWADALQGALDRVATDADGWRSRAQEHARGFSWERTVDGLLAAYTEAAQGSGARWTTDGPGTRAPAGGPMTEPTPDLIVLRRHLDAMEVPWEPGAREGETVVTLPGERKLRTVVSLLLGRRALELRAFVIRAPDENHAEFYRYLLRRALRLPGLGYAVDASGDVYLTGRVPARALDEQTLDELLGGVLTACDEPFNDLLRLGFWTSIRREWAWRVDRGESTANLEAFRAELERR